MTPTLVIASEAKQSHRCIKKEIATPVFDRLAMTGLIEIATATSWPRNDWLGRDCHTCGGLAMTEEEEASQ